METLPQEEKQNITLRLSKETLRKARVLAAKHETSMSGFLTSQIEQAVNLDDDYQRAMRDALAMMEKGFDLGGSHKLDRDALHER